MSRKPAYPRSFPGLLAALLVTVLAVFAFVGFRGLFRDNQATPIRSVAWKPWFAAARQEKLITVAEPATLPHGWIAHEATYRGGALHLAMLTDEKKYVGLEEAPVDMSALVSQYVDQDATPGKPVTIAGRRWGTWTDAGGDYAVGRTVGSGRTATAYLVVGSAPDAQIRAFAATLK